MSLIVNTLSASVVVKEATRELHTEVENLLLPKLASVAIPADYAAILKMFYGYFSPLESMIQQHITPAELPDIAQRRKADAILHDLQTIGFPTTAIEQCHQLPSIANPFQAFGVLYVLEGSTLGGKMIAKMLLKNQALSLPEEAVTFFSGYREETGSKWTQFLDVLNRQDHVNEIVMSANDTFYHLKCWMQNTFHND